MRSALEHWDRIALAELHDRLFPVWPAAGRATHALLLAALIRRPHTRHLDPEQLLDRRADLRLRRVGVHLERVLAALLVRGRALLGDQRPHDRAVNRNRRHWSAPPLPCRLARGLLLRAAGRGRALRRCLPRAGFLGGALLRRRLLRRGAAALRAAPAGRGVRRTLGLVARRAVGLV